jgi:hypothetical protein
MKARIGFYDKQFGTVEFVDGKLVYTGPNVLDLRDTVMRYLGQWDGEASEEFVEALPGLIGAGYLWCTLVTE